jgi:hypothetical protein
MKGAHAMKWQSVFVCFFGVLLLLCAGTSAFAHYADGPNLYAYVKDNPTNKVDPMGTWGAEVHMQETRIISQDTAYNFNLDAGQAIADADQGVDDNWSTSPLNPVSLGRHLDTGGGSQMKYYRGGLKEAISDLKKGNSDSSYCWKAMDAFGKGLHSYQDTSSHRSYPYGGGWPYGTFHPSWWDYYGTLPTDYANVMGNINSDTWWEEQAVIHGHVGDEYDSWKNSARQVQSQKAAQEKVRSDTRSAFGSIISAIDSSCACRKALLRK